MIEREPEAVLMTTLRRALSLRRPHKSREEGMLLASLMHPSLLDSSWVDAAGNLHIDRRRDRSRTLFVAHVDTVHQKGGVNTFDSSGPIWRAKGVSHTYQAPPYMSTPSKKDIKEARRLRKPLPKAGLVTPKPYTVTVGEPLGADDGAGVAMLSAMIAGGVPGYYIFTRGEERGGVGSKFLADHHKGLLAEFDRAIAFDRKDVFSVITHQMAGRCCSDTFAEALSSDLNNEGLLYMPDDGGVYTDTAEFIDIIPECTNISVGYYDEHSARESLDTDHLKALLKAALHIQWDSLPLRRDPTVPDPIEEMGHGGRDWWHGKGSWLDEDEPSLRHGESMRDPPTRTEHISGMVKQTPRLFEELSDEDAAQLADPFFVDDNPAPGLVQGMLYRRRKQ